MQPTDIARGGTCSPGRYELICVHTSWPTGAAPGGTKSSTTRRRMASPTASGPTGRLDRVEPGRPGGFRALLYGVIRVVALRVEVGRARANERGSAGDSELQQVCRDETHLSVAFDRAWASALLREASERQSARAKEAGEAAVRRVELLRLRFHDGLPVREIALRWRCDAEVVHRENGRARHEFKATLAAVVACHYPESTSGKIDRECAGLLALFD